MSQKKKKLVDWKSFMTVTLHICDLILLVLKQLSKIFINVERGPVSMRAHRHVRAYISEIY